jgi:hypothetical protein
MLEVRPAAGDKNRFCREMQQLWNSGPPHLRTAVQHNSRDVVRFPQRYNTG